MSVTSVDPRYFDEAAPRPTERGRGLWGMRLFVATEAMLFVLLFFAYFYLGASNSQWPLEKDPSFKYALILLGILLLSSFVAAWGEAGIRKDSVRRLNAGVGLTLLLGFLFLGIQALEYHHHLKELRPTDSAYGSIFYTITSLHLAHVVIGLLLLVFIFARGLAGHFSAGRHLAVKNAIFYWHFVDVVWVFVVAILYIAPHLYGE